jgi:translocation protein SEC63
LQAEKKKAKVLKNQATGSQRLFTVGTLANAFCLAVAYGICIYLIMLVWNDRDIAQFDPYLILEIAKDAEDRVIRKAYRSLSLKWHPDKNPGNQYAEQMFMMVRKAYEALTDEVRPGASCTGT